MTFVRKTSYVKRSRKHRYIKPFALLLAAVLLCGTAGCRKDEGQISELGSSSGDSQSFSVDNSTSDDTSSEQDNDSDEFDFDEAVKNITLFGHKISLPCAWSDFGEDFSYAELFPVDNDLFCRLYYKGKQIGNVVFGDCNEYSEDIESKQVVSVIGGHTNYDYPYENEFDINYLDKLGYYLGLVEFEVGGITMESSERHIKDVLGEPNEITEGINCHIIDYEYSNGYILFSINDDDGKEGKIIEFHVYAKSR